MTRQMAESAIGFAERGIDTAALTPEVRGLEAFAERFAATGVRVFRVPRLVRAAIMPIVEQTKPELVRLVSGTFPPNIALASRLMSEGLPVIETLHAMTMRERLPLVRLFDSALSPGRRYRAVALSAPMYDECLRRVPGLKPWLRVVDYGMPLPGFSDVPERERFDVQRPFRIFTAARLVEDHKDTTTLLHAFALLLERLTGRGVTRELVELRIAGDGRDRGTLEALARELGIANRVVFLGWVGDVRAEMRMAHVFVLSTKSESFGRVNVEAAAAGTPVVASRVIGCLASVEDGGNGLLVEPGDAGQLAGALALLFGDGALRERLGQRGPEFAARFSMDRHVRGILDLAGELLLRRW